MVASGVKRAINEPDKMVAEALPPPTTRTPPGSRAAPVRRPRPPAPAGGVGWGTRIRQILLTGVSYMIPFVAAGGLLIALGFLFGGYEIAKTPDGEATESFGNVIALTNSLTNLPVGGFAAVPRRGAVQHRRAGVRVPGARAGRLHRVRHRRPARHRAGFTAGAVAVFVGGGFIGGIVGGLIAGFAALWISRIPSPRWLRGLMPVVIIPLFASLIVGLLMFFLLGRPLAAITSGLTNWLNGMTGTSVILLGDRPRPDDVLRPGRPGQQGGLRVRRRGAHRRQRRRRCGSWRR